MFNNWPYTNLNELNLDWILQQVKGLEDKYTDLDSAIAAGVEAVQHQEEVSLQDMDNMKMTIITAINGVRDVAIVDVNATKTNAINDIGIAQETAESAITADKTAAQTAIETDKTNALAAIAALGNTWDEHYESLIAEMPADLASITQTLAILGRILTGESEQTVTFFMGDYAGGSKTDPTPASTSDVSTNMIIGGAGFKFSFTLDENEDADTKIYSIRWFEGKDASTGVYTDEHVVSCGNVRTYNWTVPDTCYGFSITLRNSETLFTEAPASDIATFRWYTTISDFVSVDGDQDFTDEQKAQGRENIGAASANDVTELKSAFNTTLCPVTWAPTITSGEYFKFADGSTASSNKYARTGLWKGYGYKIAIVLNNTTYECAVSYYDATGTTSGTGYLGHGAYAAGLHYIPANAIEFGVSFRRADQTTLSASDITAISAALSAYASTDTELSNSGMAADAKETGKYARGLNAKLGEAQSEIIPLVQTTKNLLDSSALVLDKTISVSGVVSTVSGYCISDYIKIASPICITRIGGGPTVLCAFYDGNKNFLSTLKTANAVMVSDTYYAVDPPVGTEYVIVCFRTTSTNKMVTPWFYPPSYIAYNATYTKPDTITDGQIPNTIQRVTDNTLQTTAKTIAGAINELYNGGGGGGGSSASPWIVSPSGDSTGATDTAAISAALTAYKYCELTAGDYYVSALDMPTNATLAGHGRSTRITLPGDDSTTGYIVKMGSMCAVRDLCVIGGASSPALSATLINRHGILWEGTYSTDQQYPKLGIVSNVRGWYFKGSPLTLRNTGTPVNGGLCVSDCYFTSSRAGIDIAKASEYNRFTNVQCYGCYYGCINNGGNNVFVNCTFSNNEVGFLMSPDVGTSTGQSLSNVQHGSAVGCTFNHIDEGEGDAIRIKNGVNGFIFSGGQLFYSKINLENVKGIVFDGMNFGETYSSSSQSAVPLDITINGGGVVLFANCMFQSQPAKNVTDNTDVHFANCYIRSTGAAVS